jgi:hypothetical protein
MLKNTSNGGAEPSLNTDGNISQKGKKMSVPSKANIDKLDNPARPKTNHQAETEPSV